MAEWWPWKWTKDNLMEILEVESTERGYEWNGKVRKGGVRKLLGFCLEEPRVSNGAGGDGR